MSTSSAWFHSQTGHQPRPWQDRLIAESACRSRLIRVPTGQGKTLGVLAAWVWNRCHRNDASWPRRLVWCLPMRVLTEQTVAEAQAFLQHAGFGERVAVHTLMGGADAGEWFLYPEREAVLIGTQDMLLSRAMNRGYASPRARWPLEFGLLSQDSLWVYDEIQLMDVGLATSAQVQAYRDADAHKALRPAWSWWMSATLQPQWLDSVDTTSRLAVWTDDTTVVHAAERTTGPAAIIKTITTAAIPAADAKAFAARIQAEHRPGSITLVVCNTVQRACDTAAALTKQGRSEGLELVHSRFRPAERASWRTRFLNRGACSEGTDRIIIATQVVEAGVDISADTVITDLAPWPSLVQRFGRCARYEGSGRVLVIDRGQDEKTAVPYEAQELVAAWQAVQQLDGVGIARLEAFEESLSSEERAKLYPYDPPHLLLRREYDELFDTTPDLTGADLDISRFIRSGDERDCLVFWTALQKGETPSDERRPQREELCRVPFLAARDWLCDKGKEALTGGKHPMRAWVWDWIDGAWRVATRSRMLPGRIVCVDAACGGYDPARGFDSQAAGPVAPVITEPISAMALAQEQADDSQEGEPLSRADAWKTIACHGGEVASEARLIATALGVSTELSDLLALAGRWHDLGKAHPAFQSLIVASDRPDRCDMAKAPNGAWHRRYRCADGERQGFRHELASMLALFAILQRHRPDHPALLGPWTEVLPALGYDLPAATATTDPTPLEAAILALDAPSFDLLAYLVVAHHGKVRVALHASPVDQDFSAHRHDERGLPIRGVREGDLLPATMLDPHMPSLPELFLTLSPSAVGLSPHTGRSWRERTLDLQTRFGPAALALLEAILIAADRRASRLLTADPSLSQEAFA